MTSVDLHLIRRCDMSVIVTSNGSETKPLEAKKKGTKK